MQLKNHHADLFVRKLVVQSFALLEWEHVSKKAWSGRHDGSGERERERERESLRGADMNSFQVKYF